MCKKKVFKKENTNQELSKLGTRKKINLETISGVKLDFSEPEQYIEKSIIFICNI
jgi:hypothetical protein